MSYTKYSVKIDCGNSFLVKMEEVTSRVRWASGAKPSDVDVSRAMYVNFETSDDDLYYEFILTKGIGGYGEIVSEGYMLNMLRNI